MAFEPIIREFKKSDAEEFHAAVTESVADAFQWLPWCHPGYSIDEAKSWVHMQQSLRQDGREYNYVITDRQSGKILGGTGLNSINSIHKFCLLGYWVRSSCTGKGIATLAARQTARIAFEDIGINRIEILMAVGNEASKKVAQKTGALYEGIARQKLFLHNKPIDAHVYAMLKENYLF